MPLCAAVKIRRREHAERIRFDPKNTLHYTDRFSAGGRLRTGDDFRTGSASGPGPLERLKADKVNPWGPGSVDYMRFLTGAQGTMGFVTWAVVKTEILPALRKLFFIGAEDLKPLTGLAGRLLAKRVPDECLILNSVNLAAILSGDEAEHALLKTSLPRWTLLAACPLRPYPEERVRIQEKYQRELACSLERGNVASGAAAGRNDTTMPIRCWRGNLLEKPLRAAAGTSSSCHP